MQHFYLGGTISGRLDQFKTQLVASILPTTWAHRTAVYVHNVQHQSALNNETAVSTVKWLLCNTKHITRPDHTWPHYQLLLISNYCDFDIYQLRNANII